jgi:hypothetical protein
MSTMYVNNIAPLEGNTINVASGSTLYAPGSVVQVVEGIASTQVRLSSAGTWTDIGLSATITPTSTSSKILVLASVQYRVFITTGDNGAALRVLRDTTQISGPSGSPYTYEIGYSGYVFNSAFEPSGRAPVMRLDSPSSTSAITYKIQGIMRSASGSNLVDFQDDDAYSSDLVLMEIAQ